MIRAVFIETYKQTWKQMVYWGIGLASMGLLVVLMVPMLNIQQLVDLLHSLPPVILGMIGIGSDFEMLATPEGFVAMGFFGKMALIFSVYPVVMGMRISANDEDSGILDMILSLPMQRTEMLIGKFLAYMVSIIGVVSMIYIGMWLGVAISGIDFDIGILVSVIVMLIPVLVFLLAFTMFIATLVRRKQVALGIVTAFVITSYILQTVGAMAEGTAAESIGQLSFFTYYNAGNILRHGMIGIHIALLVGLTLAFLGLSLYRFERRDVGI